MTDDFSCPVCGGKLKENDKPDGIDQHAWVFIYKCETCKNVITIGVDLKPMGLFKEEKDT